MNLKYRRFLFKFTIYVESPNKFYYYGHVKDHDEWFELRHARRGEAEVGVIVEGKEWVLKVLTFFLKIISFGLLAGQPFCVLIF